MSSIVFFVLHLYINIDEVYLSSCFVCVMLLLLCFVVIHSFTD